MKMSLTMGALVLIAGLVASQNSFAFVQSGNTLSPGLGDTSASGPTQSGRHKEALLQGQIPAKAVLGGAAGTDAFYAAKQAIQEMTNLSYDSDVEAAKAIIEYGNQ